MSMRSLKATDRSVFPEAVGPATARKRGTSLTLTPELLGQLRTREAHHGRSTVHIVVR